MRLASLLTALLLVAPASRGQTVAFGSSDDLFERGDRPADRDGFSAGAFGGPAYLPDRWRGAARFQAEGRSGRFSLGVGQTVHPGAGGLYGPEADEPYDLARALRYARLNPTPQSPWYVRLGPSERVTLGTGALARLYRTTTAWDERRIGLEAATAHDRVRAGAFTDDLRLTGVVGGEVEFDTDRSIGRLQRLRVGVAAVHDLAGAGVRGDSSLTGVEVTLRGDLVGDGTFALSPFVTHARYLGAGSTLGVGADVGAQNVGNALSGRARVALYASTGGFTPGFVGPFYDVNNGRSRVLVADSYYDADPVALAGTPLDSARAGLDVVLDLRVLAFGRFEVSQHLRRHLGRGRQSAFGIRLAANLPQQARFEFALERQGFRGLLDLFGDLGEENALVLDIAAPVGRPLHAFVRSRYGYRRLPADEVGPDRFLVERRFEPLVGIRVRRD